MSYDPYQPAQPQPQSFPPGYFDPHQQPGPYPYAVFTQPVQRRQSCLIHAVLLVTTVGIGNVAYSVWHRSKYGR